MKKLILIALVITAVFTTPMIVQAKSETTGVRDSTKNQIHTATKTQLKSRTQKTNEYRKGEASQNGSCIRTKIQDRTQTNS